MKRLKSLLLGLLLTGSFNAHAADAYLGIGIGEAHIGQGLFSEDDTAYKFFGGLKLHPNFAAEAAYMDLGQPVQNIFGWVQEYDVWAVALWAKGIWPVTERIDLFGKLGYVHWEYDESDNLSSSTRSVSANDLGWGIGIGFDVGEKWAIPVEYEQINGDLDKAGLFSVSVMYQF